MSTHHTFALFMSGNKAGTLELLYLSCCAAVSSDGSALCVLTNQRRHGILGTQFFVETDVLSEH